MTALAVGSEPAPHPVEHDVIDDVAGDIDRIVGTLDGSERMGARYEGRIDIERDAIVLPGTDSEQLDGIAHLACILYVLLGDLLMPSTSTSSKVTFARKPMEARIASFLAAS